MITAMRTVVLGALALGSGCNWVFGLDPVRLTDAQIVDVVPDARLPTVKLSAITPMLTSTGGITKQASFTAIEPKPVVRYGKIGEPLIDTVIEGEDVWVGYDFGEAAEPWRLVYTIPGEVPHEVIWKPSASAETGHAVALRLTPNDRGDVPPGSQFRLVPGSPPVLWHEPRVYTTNAWTVERAPKADVAGEIISHYAQSDTVPIAGTKRKPDPSNDYEVIVDYDISSANPLCYVAKGSVAMRIDLANGTSQDSPVQSWSISTVAGQKVPAVLFDDEVRTNLVLANGFPESEGFANITKVELVTYGPGGAIPLHHQTDDAINELAIGPKPTDPVPVPVGMLLARCVNNTQTNVAAYAFPSRAGQAMIGTIMYATVPIQLADGGPSVRNLMETSSVSSDSSFNLAFTGSGFATDPIIDATPVKLVRGGSLVSVPSGGTTASLDFSLTVDEMNVDLYEATLYRVDGTSLVPLREFTFTEKPLRFDRNYGQPAGTRYVFAIRAIRGMAASPKQGDFTKWSNTQTLGLTHTQVFTLD